MITGFDVLENELSPEGLVVLQTIVSIPFLNENLSLHIAHLRP